MGREVAGRQWAEAHADAMLGVGVGAAARPGTALLLAAAVPGALAPLLLLFPPLPPGKLLLGKKLGGGTWLLPAGGPPAGALPPGFAEAGRRRGGAAGVEPRSSGEELLEERAESEPRPAAAAEAGRCLAPPVAGGRASVLWQAQLWRQAQAPAWWKVWHLQAATSHGWNWVASCSVVLWPQVQRAPTGT